MCWNLTPMNGMSDYRRLFSCFFVTIQLHPICFVIGLLMYESVHFAGLFLAYGALLNSYRARVIALFWH
jgi:hypothetical protein